MRSYQIHIPSDPEELPELVGKIVKYKGNNTSEDFLLYHADDTTIELICQGIRFTHPAGPINEVMSIRVDLPDLVYEANGLTSARTTTGTGKEIIKMYNPKDEKYNPRQQALHSKLWVEPNTK